MFIEVWHPYSITALRVKNGIKHIGKNNQNNPSKFAKEKIVRLMSGSCHLDSALNVEIGVECQIFVIVVFFN